MDSGLSGLYKLGPEERLRIIQQHAKLSDEEAALLKNTGALDLPRADRMIENVIGAIHLPLGVATSFKINGKEMLVPMAIEEPSVLAAANKAAKLCLPDGFTAKTDEPIMRGQIQIMRPNENALELLKKNHAELFAIAKSYAKSIEPFGGGLKELKFRELDSKRGKMIIAEMFVDVRDAMGANTINSMAEGLAPSIKQLIGGDIRLRIISNLATERKAHATATWKKEKINGALGNAAEAVDAVEAILDAYELAKVDPYRCATHNKGIMNGIDAVAIATGNDWRAVEAGAHSYASLNGYHSLTHYEKDKNGNLVGNIELPLAVATVGGAVNTSPTAKIAIKIAGVKTAQELAMMMACVGLANNFAALYALSTTGIQQGHMKLHAKNLAVIAGATTAEEIEKIVEMLVQKKEYTVPMAKEALGMIRHGK